MRLGAPPRPTLATPRIGPSVEARLRATWKAVPEPPFDFDIAFFKSGLDAWGTENPDYFEDGVWWVW